MKKDVVIIDYGAGNIRSLTYAVERLGAKVFLSSGKSAIENAERVIFPGVGHAYHAMEAIREKELEEFIPHLKQPFLGICLGMQVLFEKSEEGNTKGIGLVEGEVKRFTGDLKIPHMGWNTVTVSKDSEILEGVRADSYVYFVHSFFAPSTRETILKCEYGQPFAAAIQKHNFYGCQFHPEKSGETGDLILKNFLNL